MYFIPNVKQVFILLLALMLFSGCGGVNIGQNKTSTDTTGDGDGNGTGQSVSAGMDEFRVKWDASTQLIQKVGGQTNFLVYEVAVVYKTKIFSGGKFVIYNCFNKNCLNPSRRYEVRCDAGGTCEVFNESGNSIEPYTVNPEGLSYGISGASAAVAINQGQRPGSDGQMYNQRILLEVADPLMVKASNIPAVLRGKTVAVEFIPTGEGRTQSLTATIGKLN